MTVFFRSLLALAATAFVLCVRPVAAAPVQAQHLSAELVAESRTVAPGTTVWLALVQDIEPPWHTYWRNPGDAGEPTKVAWSLPAGWKAGEFVWAAPRRLPLGPIMNYGYEGKVILPVPVEVPATARAGERVTLKGRAQFLVCADVCVPADAEVALDVTITDGAPAAHATWAPAIAAALAAAPKPQGLKGALEATPGGLKLALAGPALRGSRGEDAYFFPYSDQLIDQAKPQSVERGPEGLTLTLAPGAGVVAGKPLPQAEGVLQVDGKTYEVSAAPGPLPLGAAGLGAPAASGGPGQGLGLPLALGFAFLGGLILNLMPCVFPVLSMKAAAFAGHAGDERGARRQGLAFLAGVMATFLGLAGLLIAARAGGESVGWGFQLQSPPMVAALALVMLAAALNMSGLFEIGTSVQGVGAGLGARSGMLGSFFTGVLAVVVAAPCTAPFMAGALGYALTQSAAVSLLVFAALAIGFAAPFTLLSFMPALQRRLPRPGAWMETFRRALAFPMYGAAAWLVWVLDQQAGAMGLARVLAAGVVLAFAAWVFGGAQRRQAEGRRAMAPLALAAFALTLAVGAVAVGGYGAPASAGMTPKVEAPVAGVPSEPWSPARVAALRAAGTPVFVNFTAAWCVTCQVNEKVAFSTGEVAQAFRRSRATYLVADWTNRDAAIAKALAEKGRVGVPLYLVYGADGGEPKVLPQLLTPAIVADALDAAARPPAAAAR